MSFNKRWLTTENIINAYENGGLLNVKKHIGKSNVLISEDGLSSNIVSLILEEQLNIPQKWDKILELILKEKNERKTIN